MPVIDVYQGRKQAKVMRDTWGHLAPEVGRTYPGFVLFGHTAFGEHLVLDYDFKDLDGNPWTHEFIYGWAIEEVDRRFCHQQLRLWRWQGTYRVYKNGRHRLMGKVRPLRLTDRFPSRAKARGLPTRSLSCKQP